MGVGVVGLAENKANSAQLELEAGAEHGKIFISEKCPDFPSKMFGN